MSVPSGAFEFTLTDSKTGVEYPAFIALQEFGGGYWIGCRYLNGENAKDYTFIAGPSIPQEDKFYPTQQALVDIIDTALLEINAGIEKMFGVQETGGELSWVDKVKFYLANSLVANGNVISSK
tara:strand:+ start:533 stop:901 length:369 start_codon:yes stop_codon:yes gene_type:complete